MYVIEVNNRGSISAAAKKLFMAQPNLSNIIRNLEAEIEMKIFERTSTGVTPTKEGEEFIRYATEVVLKYKELEQVYLNNSAQKIELSVTTMRSSVICFKFAQYLNDFNARFSDTPFFIHFKEGSNYDVIRDIINDTANIGILRSNSTGFGYFKNKLEKHNCIIRNLPPVKYNLLMSKQHPLSSETLISPEMLKGYIEIVHADFEVPWYPYSETHNFNLRKLNDSAANASAAKVLFVYDRATLLDMLQHVNGAYAWTTTTNLSTIETYNLIEKNFEDNELEGKESIVYKANANLPEYILAFIDSLYQK